MRTRTSMDRRHEPAAGIAELMASAVVEGHYLRLTPEGHRCSCGAGDCRTPGAHPVDLPVRPGRPASTLLPLGGRCDALDVPLRTGEVGLGYLRLWAVPLGPVIADGDRMIFLVEPEAPEDPCGLMIRERLGDPRRGIRYRSDGYQPVPPSHAGTPAQPRWVVSPPRSAGRLPLAGELLGALGYAGLRLQRAAQRPVPVAAVG
jgi:hypothetical protein